MGRYDLADMESSVTEPLPPNSPCSVLYRITLDSVPGLNAPLIDAALQALPKVGMRGARALFEAAAPAVGARLSPDWKAFLARLEGRRPETA